MLVQTHLEKVYERTFFEKQPKQKKSKEEIITEENVDA